MTGSMRNSNIKQRRHCERCTRPLTHCLCAHIPEIRNRTRVLILQHPDEARHPLNTARLAVLGLQNADLWVGESFPQLRDAIASVDRALLLFPTKDESLSFQPASHGAPGSSLLIVPDGTWRKARRIVSVNPILATLPALSLPPGEPSEYRIRKALQNAAVSTIEAVVRALVILEPERDFTPLLTPFKVMVDQQIAAMGEETYRRNHGGVVPPPADT